MRYLTLEETAVFHGHLGPFLIIGYRAGEVARRILKPKDEHDLEATIFLPLRTPYTCIVDGIQCSTKCTLGKLNITVIDNGGNEDNIVIEFKCKRNGKSLKLRIKGSVIKKLNSFKSISEGANWVKTLPIEEVLEVIVAPT